MEPWSFYLPGATLLHIPSAELQRRPVCPELDPAAFVTEQLLFPQLQRMAGMQHADCLGTAQCQSFQQKCAGPARCVGHHGGEDKAGNGGLDNGQQLKDSVEMECILPHLEHWCSQLSTVHLAARTSSSRASLMQEAASAGLPC